MQVVSRASLLMLFFLFFSADTPKIVRPSPLFLGSSGILRVQHVPLSYTVAATAPLLQDEDTTVNTQASPIV